MQLFKRVLLSPLYVPAVAKGIGVLTHTSAAIFVLHRFGCCAEGVAGHDPAGVRSIVSQLRKEGYELISLREMFLRQREGKALRNTVAFTIDDGYFDQAEIAAPIFELHDCPVTIFLTSGFVDSKLWFWWDKIRFIIHETSRTKLLLSTNGETQAYFLDSPGSRDSATLNISHRCEQLPPTMWHSFVDELGNAAQVNIPDAAPHWCAPLSWEKARTLEHRGVDFGIHTVTHSRLSSLPDEICEYEMAECWRRLREELDHPVPVLAYPFGQASDFGQREVELARHLGLMGAVTGYPGKIRTDQFIDDRERCSVPRYATETNVLNVLECTSGLVDVKAWVRHRAA